MTSPRRFPPPWSAELQPNYYVVRDANQIAACVRLLRISLSCPNCRKSHSQITTPLW